MLGFDEEDTGYAMSKGMLRVLHNEMPGLDPVYVSYNRSILNRPELLGVRLAQIEFVWKRRPLICWSNFLYFIVRYYGPVALM